MTTSMSGEREAQAKAEVGHTEVGRGTAWALVAILLVTVAAVPVGDSVGGRGGGAAAAEGTGALGGALVEPSTATFGVFAAALPAVRETLAARGLLAADRTLLAAMVELERGLEHGSAFSGAVGPPLRWLSTGLLGAASEQVVPGRGEWLFLATGVELLTGPPFLARERLELRRRGGPGWETAPSPDPVAALTDFAGQLAARGIGLLVVPAPTKAAIHPDRLTVSVPAAAAPLENPSFAPFRARLEAAGIAVFDPAPLLAQAAAGGEPQYLTGDTHWRPEAVERVAAALAAEVERLAPRRGPLVEFGRREAEADDEGDLVRLLGLPPWQHRYRRQRVPLRRVTTPDGRLWSPDRDADLLLLGDSFTNVYSQPALGWGTGAGLGEQLSLHLGRPVDRIAVNAGGAHASRERLAQALASGDDRLAGKRLVVYQFAARELAVGDWRHVKLSSGE